MNDECVFAIDFTHETMTAAFVDAEGNAEGSAGFDLCDFLAGDTRPLDKLVGLLMAKARAAQGRAVAVAVSIACDLDPERAYVMNFPQAAWLNDQPLPEILGKALGLPVVMERRPVVLLCCDRLLLDLPADGLLVGCYVDMHYESAIWHRGGPLLGRHGAAGNIGHMTIHDREDNCYCGKTGCVDLYGAGVRLRQLHTMIFPDTPREELFVRHGQHPIVRDYLAMMAYPIAIEANILDPDFLILGGEIPSMRDFPRHILEEEVRGHCYSPLPAKMLAFLPSAASSLPGVVPAAWYAFEKLKNK